MAFRMNIVEDNKVTFVTPFDYGNVKRCNTVAIIPSDFRIMGPTSRFFRDPEGLNLNVFDLVATDRFAKHYLLDREAEVKTLELACNEHEAGLVIVVHHAEFQLPGRFLHRREEKEFHEDRMLDFTRKLMGNHPGVRILPIYIAISKDGEFLEYVSLERLLHGGKEEIVWRVPFSFRNVLSCKYLLAMCLDFRYRKETFDMVHYSLKVPYYHLLGAAGSCKGIISGNETVLKNIEKARKAGAEEAIAIQHAGCAAYKKDLIGMSPVEEENFQKDQLRKSGAIFKSMGFKDVFLSYARLTEQNMIEFIVVK